jgi:predicted naringenin-chalcone synthase
MYISNFCIIRPEFEVAQEKILEWLVVAHAQSEKRASGGVVSPHLRHKLLKIGLGEDKIQTRGLSFPDVFHFDWDKMSVYNLEKSPSGYSFKERTRLFDTLVTRVFERFYPLNTPLPCHLVHVTCTGYVAPSGAQKLVSARQSFDTTVTHAYHMGCCAAMPALRMAQGFIMGGKQVDIVHTEISSLHMNPLNHDTEQLVIQTLFADGYIKYTVSDDAKGLSLLALYEEIIPDSLPYIGWECHEWGLSMQLSREVPVVIAKSLVAFLQKLADKTNVSFEAMLKRSFFAIHPGGVKIIEAVEKLLKLEPWQTAHSRAVMQSYGNMSSATQPHIWAKIADDPLVLPESYIVSFGFGPGITISGGVFQKCPG